MLGLKLNHVNKRVPMDLLPTWIARIPVWINNYIHYMVWGEINYPFPNFNGCTIEIWELITYFIRNFTGHMITYPYWYLSYPW